MYNKRPSYFRNVKRDGHGRTDVKLPRGQEANFGVSMFEPEVFGSKCAVLKKSSLLVILLGLFGAPALILRPPS